MKEDKNISLISHFLTFEVFDMSPANFWKQTNKQTIDSNAVSKVFNRKRWTGQSFSKMKTPANIVKITYVLGMWHSFFQLCVSGYDLLLAGWDLCYQGVSGCGWVWPFFGWVWVSLGKCGWMWVSAQFISVCATTSRRLYFTRNSKRFWYLLL